MILGISSFRCYYWAYIFIVVGSSQQVGSEGQVDGVGCYKGSFEHMEEHNQIYSDEWIIKYYQLANEGHADSWWNQLVVVGDKIEET